MFNIRNITNRRIVIGVIALASVSSTVGAATVLSLYQRPHFHQAVSGVVQGASRSAHPAGSLAASSPSPNASPTQSPAHPIVAVNHHPTLPTPPATIGATITPPAPTNSVSPTPTPTVVSGHVVACDIVTHRCTTDGAPTPTPFTGVIINNTTEYAPPGIIHPSWTPDFTAKLNKPIKACKVLLTGADGTAITFGMNTDGAGYLDTVFDSGQANADGTWHCHVAGYSTNNQPVKATFSVTSFDFQTISLIWTSSGG